MENKVEIKELTLQLGKKEVVLTVDEARKLKKALEDIFGRDIIREIKEEHHYHDNYPRWGWYYEQKPLQPYFIADNNTKFLCASNGNATLSIQ